MSGARVTIHDGQADAMPCACPACTSPFITANTARRLFAIDPETGAGLALAGVIRRSPNQQDFADVIENIAAAKVCPVWCGDACTCGRGPESADLDPLDVVGMRSIEGRA